MKRAHARHAAPASGTPPTPTPAPTPSAARVIALTPEQVAGYQVRFAALARAQDALADYSAGVLTGHGIPNGTVTGFDPDARELHVRPSAASSAEGTR